jgi:hypothetical protein
MVDRDGYLMLPLLRDRHEMMVYARNNPEEKLAPLYLHPSPPIPDSSSGEAGDDNRVDHERVRELARGNTRATAHEGYDMARELLFLRSRPAPPPESEGEAKGRWKCTECWCHSFTRIDKQHQPSGNFVPSDDVRCDNCKAVSRYPATLPANHKLVPVEATDLAAAQTDTEPHFAEALARDRPSLYTRLDPDAVRICPRRDGPCPHGVSCTYWQIDMDCSTEPRAALPPAKGDGV